MSHFPGGLSQMIILNENRFSYVYHPLLHIAYITPTQTDTMKLAIISLLVASATAFAPVAKPAFGSALSAVETGAKGKPAKSAEEDLELTREIIRAAMGIDADDAPEEKKDDEDKKKE
jgi:hypothetical protein